MKNIRANDQNRVTVPLSQFAFREDDDALKQKLEAAITTRRFVDIANKIFDAVGDWYLTREDETSIQIASYGDPSGVYYIYADKNKSNYPNRIINACTKLLVENGVDEYNAMDVLDAISMLLTNKHIQEN